MISSIIQKIKDFFVRLQQKEDEHFIIHRLTNIRIRDPQNSLLDPKYLPPIEIIDGKLNEAGQMVIANVLAENLRKKAEAQVVDQKISVDGSLTVQENMMLMAQLYDVPYRECKRRIQEMLTFLNLDNHAQSLVRTLSGGMIRKLEIGQAMLHHPRILFLDEPTTGVDPIAKRNIWEHLVNLRKTFGTTIFFSTHNLEEADESAGRVAIMNTGEIAVIGSITELKEKTKKNNATIEDAFIFFAGNSIEMEGNFRDIRRTRKTEGRLG